MDDFKPEPKIPDTSTKNSQERLAVRIEIASPDNPKHVQACLRLRRLAITGKDKGMFNLSEAELEEELSRDAQAWQEILERDDMFYALLFAGSEAGGIGRAKKQEEEGVWSLGSAFVEDNFRGGAGKKMFAARLLEIIKRGGKKVEAGINVINEKNIGIAESFGFKTNHITSATPEDPREWNEMELDLSDPTEVIKKIDAVLNAG